MNHDDLICLCYHVSLRKLVHFARRERPQVDARMSECLGAGTGCGWCIPVLARLAVLARQGRLDEHFELPHSPAEYAAMRAAYRRWKAAQSADSAEKIASDDASRPARETPPAD
ncbi:MAG: (2Fe-2S)-binding protein [Phycisphaerae bacterium]